MEWRIIEHANGFVLKNEAHGRLLYARTDGDYEHSIGASSNDRVYADSRWSLVPC